jgi:hypothetical protein
MVEVTHRRGGEVAVELLHIDVREVVIEVVLVDDLLLGLELHGGGRRLGEAAGGFLCAWEVRRGKDGPPMKLSCVFEKFSIQKIPRTGGIFRKIPRNIPAAPRRLANPKSYK